MEELILKAEKREAVGGLTAKNLRKQGLTPGVIYGHGESRNVSVNYHDFEMLMHTMHSEHALVKLQIDTDELHVLVKDAQRDIVTHNVIHIDFLVVNLDETIKVQVQIETLGEPEGVKNHGGVLELLRRDVSVECKAGNIPASVKVEVSLMDIHDVLRVSGLPEIPGVTYIDDLETTLITIAPPTVHEEEEEEPEEGEEEALEPEIVGEKKPEDEEESK